ncbi:MAG: alpha/beta hydrolase [Pseudomonadota bacterium]
MKSLIRVGAILLVALSCYAAVVVLVFPNHAVRALIRVGELKAGVKELSVSTDAYEHVSYYDNQVLDKPVLLMLHGITGSKENWLDVAAELKGYRVIAIDLIGHGKTKPQSLDYDYTVDAYVSFLHEVVDELALTKFTLVGNSMGGLVAGKFAHKYPQFIEKIIFIDNAGIDSRLKTVALMEGLNENKNRYVVRSLDEFKYKLDLLFHKQPPLPKFVIRTVSKHFIELADLHQKLFDDLNKDGKAVGALEPYLKSLNMDVLIIWGKEDKVIHVSSIEKMQTEMPHARVHVFEQCGHVPMVEKPVETAQVMTDFLEGM